MGSSSGITRGQLRPHFAGRHPPLLVAVLLIALGFLGVIYFSLSSEFNALQIQLENMAKSDERNRLAYEEKSKQYEMLSKKVDNLRESLDSKENEISVKQNDINNLKETQKTLETNFQNERNHLQTENKILDEKTAQLQKQLDDSNGENAKLKSHLASLEKSLAEKETKIGELTNKINELNAKVSPTIKSGVDNIEVSNKADIDKAALEPRLDASPVDPNITPLGNGDHIDGGDVKNGEISDDVNKPGNDQPNPNVANNVDQKASLPKPNLNNKPEASLDEIPNTELTNNIGN